MGGGICGGIGGLGKSLGGNINGTLDTTRTASDAATQARADARRADRTARREAARQRKLGLQPDASTSSAFATNGAIAGRPVAASGNANADIASRLSLDAPGVRTRGIVAASQRGMQRVAGSARGVPVFVAASAQRVVVGRTVAAYPV